jgi:hypothetical protein
MKYAVKMGLVIMIHIQIFIKIGSGTQMLSGENMQIQRYTDTQTG